MNTITVGVIGLIGGIIGSIFAPWVHWGIEKKRKKYERRVELIDGWREILSTTNFERSILLNNPLYGAMRELLNNEVREKIERSTSMSISIGGSPVEDYDKGLVLKEIARIEKLWKII